MAAGVNPTYVQSARWKMAEKVGHGGLRGDGTAKGRAAVTPVSLRRLRQQDGLSLCHAYGVDIEDAIRYIFKRDGNGYCSSVWASGRAGLIILLCIYNAH